MGLLINHAEKQTDRRRIGRLNRFGEVKCLILDARHEKMRHAGVLRGGAFITSDDHAGPR